MARGFWLLALGRKCAIAALLFGFVMLTGCTSRGITVTSVPPGAEVSINHRVVGVTPIRVGFTHYGCYRIELRKEKFQVLVREENIKPPIYGYDPGAAVVDNLIPARLNDEVYLHYVMKPLEDKAAESEKKAEGDDKPGGAESAEKTATSERDALMERALAARDGRVTHPKTGEQFEIALKREPKAPAQNPDGGGEGQLVASSDTKDKPTGLEPVVKEFKIAPPEGVRLAKEFNLDKPDVKKDIFKDPNADQTPATPKVIRTPKDEELIYDKPDLKEPEEKKPEKKSDKPKKN